MLDNIKSNFICKRVLEYIEKKTVLNIFKYNKYYQSKFDFNKNDYLFKCYDIISKDKDLENNCFIKEEPDNIFSEDLFNSLRNNLPPLNISNDILKENIIKYFAINENYILSISHIYFNEILMEKIALGQKNLKIKFNGVDCLSDRNITSLYLINSTKEKIQKYIHKRCEFNNNNIKKLENLLNSDIVIKEFYFGFKNDFLPFCVDHDGDLLSDENNLFSNFKLKRAKLINTLLEKNCKNITKMKYLIIDKKSLDNWEGSKEQILPKVELDKFENLESLDLDILYNGDLDEELIFNFTNKLNKLKYLKINGHIIDESQNLRLYVYLQKKTLDILETLKIKNAKWFIQENESFNFKNIKNLHINNFLIPEENNKQKKYFCRELLKGNVNWEKLEKLKISQDFGNKIEYKEEYINKEIINFLNITNIMISYDENIPYIFKHIFENQNLNIKTNEYNKNIEELKIKLYDMGDFERSYESQKIIYEKKGKNVNITVDGRLYGEPIYKIGGLEEPLLKYINLDNIKIEPCLDSFTINHHTLNELKEIKNFIDEQLTKIKNYEIMFVDFKKKYKAGHNINFEKEINDLKKKKKDLVNQIKIIWKDYNNESYFLKAIYKIQKYGEIYAINNLIEKLKYLQEYIMEKKNENKNEKNDKKEDDNIK